MRTQSILVVVLMVFAFSLVQAQSYPPRHKGMYPRLLDDGKVVDMEGRQLGFIARDGKVCDVTGNVLGVIAASGEVAYANGKGIIGIIQEDKSLFTNTGTVVVTDNDGVVKVSGKAVAFVDRGYLNQAHGCVLHCFFSKDYTE